MAPRGKAAAGPRDRVEDRAHPGRCPAARLPGAHPVNARQRSTSHRAGPAVGVTLVDPGDAEDAGQDGTGLTDGPGDASGVGPADGVRDTQGDGLDVGVAGGGTGAVAVSVTVGAGPPVGWTGAVGGATVTVTVTVGSGTAVGDAPGEGGLADGVGDWDGLPDGVGDCDGLRATVSP